MKTGTPKMWTVKRKKVKVSGYTNFVTELKPDKKAKNLESGE